MSEAPAGIYSVPRKFDLASMLTVTTSYALLFALLRQIDPEGSAFLTVAGMITCVALSQPILFRGKAPRLASILAGFIFLFVWLHWGQPYRRNQPPHSMSSRLLISSMLGGTLGYLSGTMVAGIFLVADSIRKRIHPPPETDPPLDANDPT